VPHVCSNQVKAIYLRERSGNSKKGKSDRNLAREGKGRVNIAEKTQGRGQFPEQILILRSYPEPHKNGKKGEGKEKE